MINIIGLIYLIGFSFLIFVMAKDKSKYIRIDWSVLPKFIALMLLVELCRFAIYFPQPFVNFEVFRLIPMVWLEDACFVLPIYIIKDMFNVSKKVWIPVAIVLSLIFGFLHLGYGILWASIALLYPFVISYRYSLKYGIGTIMCCHVLYDFITVLFSLIRSFILM